MTDELERIWKESVLASFKAVSRHLSGGTVENHEERQSGLPVSGLRFDLDLPNMKHEC
jgi:hypothetical protein